MKAIKIIMLFMVLSTIILVQSCSPTQVPVSTDKVATQADIDALYKGIENGGLLKLKNLTYYLDKPIAITGQSNFTLDGNGCTFIMKDKQEDVIFVRNSENVILKNFKATHIEPEGPIGCTGSVIQVANNAGITIEKCELNGSGIIGVVAYNTKDLKVTNNYIYNNSKYGVLYDTETTLEIIGNRFEDNGDSGNYHVGKALDGGLSQVEKIEKGTNQGSLKMSGNTFK